MYTNFLNTDFDGAEGLLLGTVRACEDKCAPALIAKIWMYVGIVRGSGRNDLPGAVEAFTTAIATDPSVALDAEIATDPVKAAFAQVKGGGGQATTTATPPSGGSGASSFTCAPSPTEVETRRPVPMQCETDKQVASAKLYYKSFGQGWSSVKMELHEGTWRGAIPCAATQGTGKLKFYVAGLDDENAVVASLGDKEKPRAVDVVSETSAEPPAFPEEEPPARCGLMDAPPAGPGDGSGGACGSWGAPCGANGCCEGGLSCNSGVCEGKCESNADCKNGGTCNEGKCEGGEGGEAKTGPVAKNWIGLHFGVDLASVSEAAACAPASRENHVACFVDGKTYANTPYTGAAGNIQGGFTPSTMRVLASYEHVFGPIGLEARLGFAFNGGQTPDNGGQAFLPVHAEARGKFWVLGEAAFAKPGFRPWVHLGGGLAQVDATVSVQIADCGAKASPACLNAPSLLEARKNGAVVKTVDATKQLGQSFVTAGGGIMYAVGKNHGAVLTVNFMVPFPSSGFVLEPTLGYQFGF